MDDQLKFEIQAIRSELSDIRREMERMDQKSLPRPLQERPSGREGFMYDFKMHLSDHILRLPARIRVEHRLEALEQRVAEIEARRAR